MVDDKPGRGTQAVRTQTRVVSVAGHHQQVDLLGDRPNDFALDPSPTMEELRILTAEPRRGGGEQL
jgi:hypothetical protein